ncbi:MAG TPA: EamA family transporter [Candidatus Bathyarchaeia archaeon]
MNLRAKIALAFLAVYLIWGSTYLAIGFAVDSLPPFFMAGTRFIVAGFILYAFTRLRGAPKETKIEWRNAFVIGGLMLLGGNGAVTWAEQYVPSGVVSLLVGTVPLLMVFSDWLWNRSMPSFKVIAGLVLGFAGIALLSGSFEGLGAVSVDVAMAGVVVFGAFLWANGSLYSRSAKLPSSPLHATAMEMIGGGVSLLLASLVAGELPRVRLDLVSMPSMVSWVYLVVVGSFVGFTCYIWLLKVTTLAKASTYAYVNPIVAMFLGWQIADEPLTLRNVVAAAIILTAVITITLCQTKGKVDKELKNKK